MIFRLLLAAMAAAVLASAPPAVAQDVALTGATLYPDPDAEPISDAVILIRDGRILQVGRGADVPIPTGFAVTRLDGKFLVAGFWNTHVHLITPAFLTHDTSSDEAIAADLRELFLRWGFTSVFDLASTTSTALAIRERVEAGAVVGPNILTVGAPFYPRNGTPIYAREFYEAFRLPNAEIVSIAQAVARVEAQAEAGASGVKLFTGAIIGGPDGVIVMPLDEARAIVAAAHRLGPPAFAHPTDAAGLAVAVESGVDVLAHAAVLAGPFSPAQAADLAERNVALVPTLALFTAEPHPSTPVEIAIQQVRALAAAGGDILFGTDVGFADVADTGEELRLLGEALTWRQVLASLTTTPARRFDQSDQRGQVTPGLRADLVALDADPASDVTAFSRVSIVWRDGDVVYRLSEPAAP